MNNNFVYPAFGKGITYPTMQTQPQAQIPFKPLAFERISDIIGIAYNLSSMENVSVLPAPRQNEQQIFFIDADDKIYARTADAGIGIVGYKQEYVQKLENELLEAQNQLFEIFNSVCQENTPVVANGDISSFDDRLTKIENLLSQLMEVPSNDPKRLTKNVGSISDLA